MVGESKFDDHGQRYAPPRVVLADDDPVVRSMLASQLERSFECVGAAADAGGAIALVATHKPDVAILDVNMPGGGAMRATREIHSRYPETAIVILSSDETRDEVIELIISGAITYLRKGIDPRALIATLFGAIEAQRRLLGPPATEAAPSRSRGNERS